MTSDQNEHLDPTALIVKKKAKPSVMRPTMVCPHVKNASEMYEPPGFRSKNW